VSTRKRNEDVARAIDWRGEGEVPSFDADWSVTGPLVERYALRIEPVLVMKTAGTDGAESQEDGWRVSDYGGKYSEEGEHLLPTICRLLIEVGKRGGL
jgi:CRISPR/Cas system type I-B associated protein Csh2 (Cas7 group RAMP superfamily)